MPFKPIQKISKNISLVLFLNIGSLMCFCNNAKADNLFGPNVFIFDPTQSQASIQNTINTIFGPQQGGEFNSNRYAFFFKPGTYGSAAHPLNVPVGYYTHVLGLGEDPTKVIINGQVKVNSLGGKATVNFWRMAENLTINNPSPNVWAVSQAGPLRNIHVINGLQLHDVGWISGGFMANSKIEGTVDAGNQQQWMTRNSEMRQWVGGAWNMVFSGIEGGIPGGAVFLKVPTTPVIREKPFLYIDSNGAYYVKVPALRKNSTGVDWSSGNSMSVKDQFYIAHPTDTAETLNSMLAEGKSLILTPGIYVLEETLRITRPDTVVLGLGIATLTSKTALPLIKVADVDGVSISGILLDAGLADPDSLMQVGDPGSSADHSSNPTVLYDLFCRIGGAGQGKARNCVTIHSNDVIGDDFWLWRADHGAFVGWGSNTADNGLTVNGKNVTIYGLAVEHFQKNQTLWNGENGQVIFYQSELPYDIPNQASWKDGIKNGYASYKVGDGVTQHHAWGVGVYSYYRDAGGVKLDNAIEAPNDRGLEFDESFTMWLSGNGSSQITHEIDGQGATTNGGNHGPARVDRWVGSK